MAAFEHSTYCTKAEYDTTRKNQKDTWSLEVGKFYTAMFMLQQNATNKEAIKLPVRLIEKAKYGQDHHKISLAPAIPSPIDELLGFQTVVNTQGDIRKADLRIHRVKIAEGYVTDYRDAIEDELQALLTEAGVWLPTDEDIAKITETTFA